MAANKNFRITADGRVFRQRRKRYPAGDLYVGEFVDGLREGRGTLEYTNGNRYIGEWKSNMYHGFGCFIWNTFAEGNKIIKGRRYEGHFEKGKMSGRGLLICGQGDRYEGEFANDEYEGQGTLTLAAGDVREGTWHDGALEGHANICFANGNTYEGGFHSGQFHGHGRLAYANGQGWYEGAFIMGRQHGPALRVFANNNRYDGKFENNELEGEGIMEYANGDVYMGAWSQGKWHGRGVLQLKNGERFEGTFHKGVKFGRGKFTWADGSYYEGDYIRVKSGYSHGVDFPDPDGKRNGRGTRVWISGDRYEGEWHADYMHGIGIVRKQSGGRFEGQFVWGQRTGPGRETWGNTLNNHFKCPMGNKHEGRGFCTYEGDYKDGLFHGKGCFACLDGRVYEGAWQRGRRHGWGEQVMLPNNHRGDPRRQYIGGVDALYRLVKYSGEWRGGQRHGQGSAEYSNGLKVSGEFVLGHFDSTVKFMWPRNQGERLALFSNGTRKHWLAPGATTGLGESSSKAKHAAKKCDAASVLKDLVGDLDPVNSSPDGDTPKQLRWG